MARTNTTFSSPQVEEVYLSVVRPDCTTAILIWQLPTELQQANTIIVTLKNLTLQTEVVFHANVDVGQVELPFRLRRGHTYAVRVQAAQNALQGGCYKIRGRSRWCEFSAGNRGAQPSVTHPEIHKQYVDWRKAFMAKHFQDKWS